MVVRSPAYKLRCTNKGLVYCTVFLMLTEMTCSCSAYVPCTHLRGETRIAHYGCYIFIYKKSDP